MRDRDRICNSIARVPGAGRLAAIATVSAVAALVALIGVGGASASAGLGGPANGSRPLGPGAFREAGPAGFGGAQLRGASRSSVPNPGHNSELSTVACVKASDCWAVGDFTNRSGAFVNEVLRFNGKKWTQIKTPSPGRTVPERGSELFGVACVSASDCWAVGGSQRGSSAPELNEALRWNGKRWSKVKTPDPGGTSSGDRSELFAVACVSASDCWAVGESERGNSAPEFNEALRWNGRKWSKVKTPSEGGTASDDTSELTALACVSASDCWAVGDSETSGAGDLNEALHWNGKRWSEVNVFNPAGKDRGKINELRGVACVSGSDCWAVGVGVNPNNKVAFNEVLHWGGKKWSHVKIPQPSNRLSEFLNPLDSVDCRSANDCWAVGYYLAKHKMALLNDAMHWNGRKWSHIHTPQPAGTRHEAINALLGVTCPSRSDCWSVGTTGSFKRLENLSNEALHWNGKRWSSQ